VGIIAGVDRRQGILFSLENWIEETAIVLMQAMRHLVFEDEVDGEFGGANSPAFLISGC
jgi:hypothetical protein